MQNSMAATKIQIEWVDIPEGTFLMGSPNDETDRWDNETQHQVRLDAFKMSKYEITFEQYDVFCEATNRPKPNDMGWGREKRPVINVSWNDAVAFTDWLGKGYRLPTEAEWEYACRAGSTTAYHTGNSLTQSQANFNHRTNRGQTSPVGSFPPNNWGLYDMHGNVWEWCRDWFNEDYYKNSPVENPQGPESGISHVFRGGSWFNFGEHCRSAFRDTYPYDPKLREMRIGFRLVYSE